MILSWRLGLETASYGELRNMQADEYIVGNFKSWQGITHIPLTKLNLIFGSNSSGKSSLIQSLSLLKQSKKCFELVANGKQIDLGRIQDQVNLSARQREGRSDEDFLTFGIRINDLDDIMQPELQDRRQSKVSVAEQIRIQEEGLENLKDWLGFIEYIEIYDDNGIIKGIKISSSKGELLRATIAASRSSKTKISLKLTDNLEFWRRALISDTSSETEANLLQKHQQIKNINRDIAQTNKHITKLTEEKESLLASDSSVSDTIKKIDNFIAQRRSQIEFFKTMRNDLRVEIDASKPNTKALEATVEDIRKYFEGSIIFDLQGESRPVGRRIHMIAGPPSGSPMRKYYLDEALEDQSLSKNSRRVLNKWSSGGQMLTKRVIDETANPFEFLRICAYRLVGLVRQLEQIGPHRDRPGRLNVINPSEKRVSVGKQGEFVSNVLNQIDDEQIDKINYWFQKLEIPYYVETEFEEKYNIFQLRLINEDGLNVMIEDVGYGIGQVLPIILSVILQKNTIITIEQPELHLHPRLQANLAELFEESCANNQNILLLETHSEHIVLRLQRKQREINENNTAQAKSDDNDFDLTKDVTFSVVESVSQPARSVLTTVRLEADGTFSDIWPGDFFPERYKELGLI